MFCSGQQNGYILLPVVLAITLVAMIAFMMNHESAIEVNISNSELESDQARYLVEAGMNHALWQVAQAGCGPYTDISNQPFGSHSYSAAITPNNAGGLITSFSVAVSDDAWIKSDSPTQNYGNDTQLSTYFSFLPSTTQRALYRFDIENSGIPAGSTVLSAVARIFIIDANDSASVAAHQITADWTEGAVNWDNINTSHNSTSLSSIPAGSPVDEYVSFNITSLVQGWINGSTANQGILLKTQGIFDHTEYTSKEYANINQRPVLEIKISDGSLSNRADISATGMLASGISQTLNRTNIFLYQATANTLNLQPGAADGKDAEIWEQSPNNNYGDAAKTWVSSASSDTTRSLLRFNMDAIPFAARILGASLSLHRQSGSGANQPVSAHRIRNPWSEDSVTWNSRESGTNWDTAGVDFDNMAVATTPVGPLNQRYEWNITPLVQGWVDSSYPNYGVVLTAAIDGMTGERFYTSDDTDPTRYPQLTITYSCECGVACIAPQGSGNVLMVVINPTTLVPADAKKKALFESWGYTVNVISESENQSKYVAEAMNNDVIYISNTVNSNNLEGILSSQLIGVINEDGDYNADLGTSSSYSYSVGKDMDITDTSHYITSLFPAGSMPIYSANMEFLLASGTQAASLQTLGSDFYGAPGLAVVETGGLLADGSSTAAGRRVMLPIGRNGSFNWDYLNNNGRLIVQRAIQWGIDGRASVAPKKVYWTDDVAEIIQRSDEDGSNVETVISGQLKVRGLDIDTANGKIYWSSDGFIRRADLDGTNIETIFNTTTETNFDVKLDTINGKMYWTYDGVSNLVTRANLDGTNVEIINSSMDQSVYFSLDAAAGFIYVTEFGSGNISRMNLDGSGGTILITGSNTAMGSGIDSANGKLYWTGGAANDWIKRANFNGSNEETLISGLNAPQDIAYDSDNDRIYWTDALNQVIQRSDADGANLETIVTGLVRPRGIVLVDAAQVPPTGGGGSGSDPGNCNGVFLDRFDSKTFTGNDGDLSWSGDWQELGETDGSTKGDIIVATDFSDYQLRIRDNDNGGEGVERVADLNGAVSALLSLDFRRIDLDDSDDYVAVYISASGTAGPWTELTRIGTSNDGSYQSLEVDISDYISPNTAIRLLSSPDLGGKDQVWFDNIQIQCSP